MANTILQTAPATAATPTSFGGATSAQVTFGSACTNGSRIVVLISQEDNAATFTVTDSAGNTYVSDKEQASVGAGGTGDGKVAIYSAPNTSTSAITVTVNPSGTESYGIIKALEITGIPTSSYTAVTAGNQADTGLPTMSLDTGSEANCTIVAVLVAYPDVSSNGGGADTGYTKTTDTAGVNCYHTCEWDADVGAAGVKSIAWGLATGDHAWAQCAVAYKSAPADTTIRPNSDVSTTGWTSTGGNFFGVIDEASVSDADYITSPVITGTGQPIIMGLSNGPLAAGDWAPRVRASVSTGTATLRVSLLNGSNVSQGSADVTVTTTTTTFNPKVTTSGSATRIQYEFLTS